MGKKDSFTLFLMVILPVHIWSLVIAFYNMQTIIHRSTRVFDGIGYTAYALLQALLEGTLLFIFLVVLGILLTKKMPRDVRLVQLTLLGWVIFSWAVFGQLYRYWIAGWLKAPIDYLFLWLSYRKAFSPVLLGLIVLVILVSVLLPVWLAWRYSRVRSWCLRTFDKISVLSMLYLALDFSALLVVLYRNLRGLI